jgi:uncharacterized protein (DUF2147 family)
MWVTLPGRPGRALWIPSAEEIEMRALLAIATLLLACSVAQAQYTIEYDGHTIRIDPDRGTVSIPGVYDNTGKKAKRARTNPDNSQKQAPVPQQPTIVDRQPGPNQAANPPAQATQVPAPVNAAPPAPNATANIGPADSAAQPQPPLPAPPPVQQPAAPVAVSPAPTAAAVPSTSAPVPAPAPRTHVPTATVATAAPAPPAPDPNSPVGIWLTEEKEGKVRIEPCGDNLCGYSVDLKSNANAEQVLINMKPAKDPNKDQKWSGRIHDPNTGSNYDSTIALKGKDELQVQGCAFGGMFCGGQTWTRVN